MIQLESPCILSSCPMVGQGAKSATILSPDGTRSEISQDSVPWWDKIWNAYRLCLGEAPMGSAAAKWPRLCAPSWSNGELLQTAIGGEVWFLPFGHTEGTSVWRNCHCIYLYYIRVIAVILL